MKINFVGDISLNDDYIRLYKEGKNPFAEIAPVLAEADLLLVILNVWPRVITAKIN